jgi:putative membrane protein
MIRKESEMMWGFDGWWMMVIGLLVMLLFWGGLIVLVVFAIRAILPSGRRGDERYSGTTGGQTSLDILKARYARGEISREEYLNIRSDLEG